MGQRQPALIDRKVAVPVTPLLRRQARRQSEALRQNGYRGRWEVPTVRDAARAEEVLARAGVTNIDVSVVPLP